MTADTDIRFLKGVGSKRAEILKSKGIDTVSALLRFYPRKYRDWTKTVLVNNAPFFEDVCVKAQIITPIESKQTRSGVVIYNFCAKDESGKFSVSLFNQTYLANKLKVGNCYLFYGKFDGSVILRSMNSPIIKQADYHIIEPIYPANRDMSSKMIEKLIKTALEQSDIPEILPEDIRKNNGLCDIRYALENIHFPKTVESFEKSKKRLVFEELFILQTALITLKLKNAKRSGCIIKKDVSDEFANKLDFEMTNAQKRAVIECCTDMQSGIPMARLIQGDVGCGKTVVAAALCFICAKNGYQSAFMAPTEILAEQHYKTFSKIIQNTDIKCGLLTGSLTKNQKDEIKGKLKSGDIDVIIGTHALISDDVGFSNLGLVITDEQHRFGVSQRGKLENKGKNPHKLVMSATPIPQTLAYILYGDLDISVIDEYPKGRQKIRTYVVDSSYRMRIYDYIKKFLDEDRQAYIVCPLVEENDESGLVSANGYYKKLAETEFKNYSVALLHGKMSPKEKETVMDDFARGNTQLLISTTVIEVGIDVPNAVIMLIENAERFGLSQLHQLRGRIGRGKYRSDCILITDSKSPETQKRLEVIKHKSNGFEIADCDLELRGPGDFLGNRQHGIPQMRIADIFADKEIMLKAKTQAKDLLKKDPQLKSGENLNLRKEIIDLYKKLK